MTPSEARYHFELMRITGQPSNTHGHIAHHDFELFDR